MTSPWMTVPEGARYLRVRRETFERLLGSGVIPAYHDPAAFGGGRDRRRMVDARDLDEFVRARKAAPAR